MQRLPAALFASLRLTASGLPMVEFPQSVPNLTEASSNLYELIKGRNLPVYPDADVARRVALRGNRDLSRMAHRERENLAPDRRRRCARAGGIGRDAEPASPGGVSEFARREGALRRIEDGELVETVAADLGDVTPAEVESWRTPRTRLGEVYNRARTAQGPPPICLSDEAEDIRDRARSNFPRPKCLRGVNPDFWRRVSLVARRDEKARHMVEVIEEAKKTVS